MNLTKRTREKLWVIIPIAIVIVLAGVQLVFLGWFLRGGGFVSDFDSVRQGWSKEAVVRILGNPDETSKDFHLGQELHFEHEYARAKASKSKYFLFWNRGLDIVFAVGFDDQDKVTMTASGGT